MREALDKLIHTATSFVPSDVENEKKGNPYASLLDNVLGESATDAEREQLNPHGKAKHQVPMTNTILNDVAHGKIFCEDSVGRLLSTTYNI